MPAPLAIAFLGFGGILTAISPVAGVISGGIGLAIEGFLFLTDGRL